ncbi:MAG: hypothetical protein EHM20_09190, partial [Alphaproteobacteria bacterium]
MKLPKVILILVGSTLLAALFIITRGSVIKKPVALSPPKIKIAINEWSGFAPVVYAQVMGLYKKNNLDVELILTRGMSESIEKFMKRETDVICTVLSDALVMRSNGVDARVVLIVDSSVTGDVIIANSKIKNMKDLKYKYIGIDALNSFSHVFVLEALAKYGIKESEIHFKIVPYDEVARSLSQGKIDAAHTWDPGKREALKAGHHVIFNAKEIPGIILDTITFNEGFIKKYPETVKTFSNVFFEAQSEMLKNPNVATAKMAHFFKNNPLEFLDSFKDIHFIGKEENHKMIYDVE